MNALRLVGLIRGFRILLITILLACGGMQTALSQTSQELKIAESTEVLNQIMQIQASSIPRAMLADAQAVAIVPRVIKGSFIVGARRGEGVVLVRDAQGNWQGPAFVTLSGGNIGWQVGVQSTDVVLVFKTRTSVEHMLTGAFTIGADAAAAAGPVGRDASIATDEQLKAEVYSYSRSRGLFAGVSIDGSVLKLNQAATSGYYDPAGTGKPGQVPGAALQLVQTLRTYTGELGSGLELQTNAANASVQSPLPQTNSGEVAELLRKQLVAATQPLYKMLDPSWQAYLAFPAEVFQGDGGPSERQLAETLTRFEAVRAGSQYKKLADRPEFQTVYELLKQYQATQANTPQVLGLPSPPSGQYQK